MTNNYIIKQINDALIGRELSKEQINMMSPESLFKEYCEWNGLIGYSSYLIDALDYLRQCDKSELKGFKDND